MRRISPIVIIGIMVLSILWVFLVGIPELTPYNAKIILKNSEIYDEPIYLKFNYETKDQIQVGELITLDIEVRGLPYKENMTLRNIELSFNETYLNYWGEDKNDKINILPIVPFKLVPDWENNVFKSQKVKFRFIIPTDIPLKYCDENLEEPCHEIPNIIHPAPYDLGERIASNRVVITVALFAAALSIIVWKRLTTD